MRQFRGVGWSSDLEQLFFSVFFFAISPLRLSHFRYVRKLLGNRLKIEVHRTGSSLRNGSSLAANLASMSWAI